MVAPQLGLQRVHFAEQWNEYQHLLVMESLGGDRSWRDRFLAQHAALAYFGLLCFAWLLSPALAYNFSELIEAHAVDTYAQFADENKALLRSMPAPRVAKAYWTSDDLYLFDASSRRGRWARCGGRASARCTTYSAPSATTRRSTSRRWGSARWRTARCPTWERWIWPPR